VIERKLDYGWVDVLDGGCKVGRMMHETALQTEEKQMKAQASLFILTFEIDLLISGHDFRR